MMKQFTSKSLITRLSLISFILLCSIFTSENAFSILWKETNKEAKYNKKDGTITFIFYSYYHRTDLANKDIYFLKKFNLQYTENNNDYKYLLDGEIDLQGSLHQIKARINGMKEGETITFPNTSLPNKQKTEWVTIEKLKQRFFEDYGGMPGCKPGEWINLDYAVFEIKWKVPTSIKTIKSVRIVGNWCEFVNGKTKDSSFRERFPVDYERPIHKAPLESNNDVKVTGKEDIITVSGVNSGEIIKVYNADTKAEIKSVIATDAVVNISLPKGHLYLIQIGQKSHKVAL